MIHVAWNLTWLRPGVVGGSEEYATRQLAALVDHAAGDVHVTAHVLAPFADAHPELASRVELVTVPLDGANKPLRVGAETTLVAMRTRRATLVHHLGGRIPLVAPGTRVLTVHDLQPLDEPQNFSPVKRRFLARAIPRSVHRARVVVTPSEHVRAAVLARFAIDPAHVRAVAAPVRVVDRTAVAPADDPRVPAPLRPLLAGEHPFVLYPAITYAHKNHRVLLDAFAQVRTTHPDARLVLTGGAAGEEEAVLARLARPDLAGAVVRTGRVDRDVLDALVVGARALAFPSRYEGFGLPVVEALAAGVRVVASDLPVLREVLDGGGELVPATDPDAWAAALGGVLDAPAGASPATAREAAARVAARYSAASTARALVEVYRAAAGW